MRNKTDCGPFAPRRLFSSCRLGARAELLAKAWLWSPRKVVVPPAWRGPAPAAPHDCRSAIGGDVGALLGEAKPVRAPQTQPALQHGDGAGGSLRPAANLDLARPVSPLIPSRSPRPSARPNCRIARAGVCSNASPNSVTCLNFPGGQAFASMVCSGFRQSGNRLAVSNRRGGFDCEVQQLRDIAISARCTPPEICLCGIAIGTRRSGSFLKRFAL
jgi:hypothetical protein